MKPIKPVLIAVCAFVVVGLVCSPLILRGGFSARGNPSSAEKILARFVRNLAIPGAEARATNPLKANADNLREAHDIFSDRCATCHGFDGRGRTTVGTGLYPKAPDLSGADTQKLSDGEIHYVIENGVRLTGMPAWADAHDQTPDNSWKLVLLIRSFAGYGSATGEPEPRLADAHYVGSAACEKCHAEIYARWKKTPMANVVRDPKEHPEAIIPNLTTNKIAKFTKEQVALVYGSVWKQRYFTKIGDDYFPEPAQWDVTNKVWRPYFVAKGTDWWEPYYAADNMQRPTGPTCDGCHSVDYDVNTKKVAEWNVGCEKCHGPGSEHVAKPERGNILNPGRMDYVRASDTCIQCHSQGRPLTNPIEGRYFDWPVGFRVGLALQDFWKLEEHKLGEQSFTHYADGTAHKNRMQGNDFVQSVMYRRGVTCASCHDAHGTENYAQLRKPVERICLDCHGPMSPNGPREATIEGHTHHKEGSAGSQCVACHMPKIQTTIADVKVSAHTFAFIYPAATDAYKVPNACTMCHADKTTAWATEEMRKWGNFSPWRAE
jgi:predicted CXXCH cytochrome family protein